METATPTFTLDPRLWAPQVRSITKTIEQLEAGKKVCLFSPTGSGKCLDPNTPVLRYDGRIVLARSVQAGDELMGPDSKPRKVLSTCRGWGPMYRVTPTKGDFYVVNDAHILTLRMNCDASGHKKGELVDISIKEYLAETKTFRHCAKGVRTGVDFPAIDGPVVPAYFMGVWLGDGTRSRPTVCLSDMDAPEILGDVEPSLAVFGVKTVKSPESNCATYSFVTPNGQPNPLLDALRELDFGVAKCEKYIPDQYKYGSRNVRLDVLAGIVDTDGSQGNGYYDLVFKDRLLAEDVAFVSRSLGLASYVTSCHKTIKSRGFTGKYFRVSISGNCDMIPCRVKRKRMPERSMNKDVLNVGIKVEPIGEGNYAGWELDGDGRFLLGDFTITHNTIMGLELLRWAQSKGAGGIFYVNRKLLIQQTSDKFAAAGLPHAIRAAEYDDRYDETMPFQVASADSERARVYKSSRWKLHDVGPGGVVLVDEAHIQKSQVMKDLVYYYEQQGAHIVFLTATPIEMGSYADTLVVGGKLSEWRACGALVPVYCYSISQPDMSKVKRNVTGEYVLEDEKKKIYTQSIVGEVIENWERLNDGSPTMAYAPGVAESIWLTEQFNKRGHNFAHVDATNCVVDGVERKLDRALWSDIMSRLEDGSIRGLMSRFKCLDKETEVLCRRGWLNQSQILHSDEVCNLDHKTGEVRWLKPKKILRRLHDGEMYSIQSDAMDLRVTDNHEVLVRSQDRRCKAWKVEESQQAAKRKGTMQIPVAVTEDAPGIELSDAQIDLLGWFLTDGHKNVEHGGLSITQSTVQPDWIHEHIVNALNGCGVEWKKFVYGPYPDKGTENAFVRYVVSRKEIKKAGLWRYMDKNMHPDLMNMNRKQLERFLYAVHLGDGSKRKSPSWKVATYEITVANKWFADRLQALCVTRGMRCNLHYRENKNYWTLYATPDRDYYTVRGCSKAEDDDKFTRARWQKEIVSGELVWCVETELGSIVTRRHGKVSVTRNCREGIDLPKAGHCVLATPIGSIASYLQIVGRVMRSAPGKEKAILQDHGGSYHSQGSPNHDRDWDILWRLKESVASNLHMNKIKEGEAPEPIRCPKCGMERTSGPKCPGCGFEATKSLRKVIMESGEIREVEGALIEKTVRVKRHNTEELWAKMYFGFKRKGLTKTFAQMEAFFCHQHHYKPTRDLPYMPKASIDWQLPVCDVAIDRLHAPPPKQKKAVSTNNKQGEFF